MADLQSTAKHRIQRRVYDGGMTVLGRRTVANLQNRYPRATRGKGTHDDQTVAT